MEDLLHEVRSILTSNDLIGAAASMVGNRLPNKQYGGGLGGLSGLNRSNLSPTNSLTSSFGSVGTNDSYDFQQHNAELLETEMRESSMMRNSRVGGSAFSPLERKMIRANQSFIEERRRNNNEANTIRSKAKENTRLRLQERERTRVLQRFNPEAIRQVAEQTTDEVTKRRLLGKLFTYDTASYKNSYVEYFLTKNNILNLLFSYNWGRTKW